MVNLFKSIQNLVKHKMSLDNIGVMEGFHLQNVGWQDWESSGPNCIEGDLEIFYNVWQC